MPLPKHLFISSDGELYDTRVDCWGNHPLRTDYEAHHAVISSVEELKATLRAGPFAWPGGYPLYFITQDGAALSFNSVRDEFREIAYSIRHRLNDGWRVVGCAINWEDSDLFCDHSGEPIEAAYELEDE